jgi:hypothetical protein
METPFRPTIYPQRRHVCATDQVQRHPSTFRSQDGSSHSESDKKQRAAGSRGIKLHSPAAALETLPQPGKWTGAITEDRHDLDKQSGKTPRRRCWEQSRALFG